jgi:hypothetical protein
MMVVQPFHAPRYVGFFDVSRTKNPMVDGRRMR